MVSNATTAATSHTMTSHNTTHNITQYHTQGHHMTSHTIPHTMTSHTMTSHVATARIGHTLNDISKFSAPHISICSSKVPISKKNRLSSANMHPSIMGVYNSLFSQIEGQRSLTTTVTCQHSKILVKCRTKQTGKSRHVHRSHIHSTHSSSTPLVSEPDPCTERKGSGHTPTFMLSPCQNAAMINQIRSLQMISWKWGRLSVSSAIRSYIADALLLASGAAHLSKLHWPLGLLASFVTCSIAT